jgi:DNA polymerase-1
VDALQELIHPETGRSIYFKQAQTATGRLSSVEPNLQNIRYAWKKDGASARPLSPQPMTGLLVSADYSQIDLRSLAHISEDEILIETFRQGIDIHTRTASEIFKVLSIRSARSCAIGPRR